MSDYTALSLFIFTWLSIAFGIAKSGGMDSKQALLLSVNMTFKTILLIIFTGFFAFSCAAIYGLMLKN